MSKNKKPIFLILTLLVTVSLIPNGIPETKSIDPYFTLKAGYLTIQQLEYLNLVKQQLARIGINLEFTFFNWSDYIGKLCILPEWDLHIHKFSFIYPSDPFGLHLFDENGSLNLAGYHTSMDWDENLGTGRNEWYIQTGVSMMPNDSQERINHCWEWQHYMMDEILPILPLFTSINNHSTLELMFFNMREVNPIIGSREPAPGFPSKTKGLLVRKAISYAINLEEIRRVVLGDEYEIFYHPTNPLMDDWLSPNSIRYCYNLDYAKKLMQAAGYYLSWCGQGIESFDYLDWEELCGGTPTSDSVSGFSYMFALGVLLFASTWIRFLLRKKRK